MSRKEFSRSVERELVVLENLKKPLGDFFSQVVYSDWGLTLKDVRLVDEAGFGYSGIPIFGPELQASLPHIDIAVLEDRYKGPKSTEQTHPVKILFPISPTDRADYLPFTIMQEYGIAVDDLLKGKNRFFSLPTIEVNLNGTPVFVPEPVVHVEYFATDTILYYTEQQVAEEKLRDWFKKLQMIKNVATIRKKIDVEKMAESMIQKSIERWSYKQWSWLYE